MPGRPVAQAPAALVSEAPELAAWSSLVREADEALLALSLATACSLHSAGPSSRQGQGALAINLTRYLSHRQLTQPGQT
jgi:hypothetical protein